MRKLTHMLLARHSHPGLLFMRSRNNSQLSSHSPAPGGCLESGIPFNLNDGTIIAYPEHNELLKRNAEFLAEYISQSTGHTLQTEALALGAKRPKAPSHWDWIRPSATGKAMC